VRRRDKWRLGFVFTMALEGGWRSGTRRWQRWRSAEWRRCRGLVPRKETREREREWAEWGNEAQFGRRLARRAGAKMKGWGGGGGGRGLTERREKGWWAEMRKEIGIKDSNFWLLI
jgi:hypothetical protein